MIFEHSQELPQFGGDNSFQTFQFDLIKTRSKALKNNDYGHLISYREIVNHKECDGNNSSFANDIYPTLKTYCVNCHNSNFAMGTVNLEGYQNILPYVQDSSLIQSVRQDPNVIFMPPTGGKIPDCNLTQIQNWINQGAKEN